MDGREVVLYSVHEPDFDVTALYEGKIYTEYGKGSGVSIQESTVKEIQWAEQEDLDFELDTKTEQCCMCDETVPDSKVIFVDNSAICKSCFSQLDENQLKGADIDFGINYDVMN